MKPGRAASGPIDEEEDLGAVDEPTESKPTVTRKPPIAKRKRKKARG
jgi:hypothetical protein